MPGESPRVTWPFEALLGPENPLPCKHLMDRSQPSCTAAASLSVCQSSVCHEAFSPVRKGLGRPQRGRAEAGETGASRLYLPLPQTSSWFTGAAASYQGPPAGHHHTSPLAAPSTRAGLCLWLQTGCGKWGAREGWGCHRAPEALQGAALPDVM